MTSLSNYKDICKKLNGGNPVFIPEPDPKNAKEKADIMFINERPGPRTTETKIVSFDNPDGSARLFKHLFCRTFGEKYRRHIYITNAIIWVPDEGKSGNYTPTNHELGKEENLDILREQITQIKPRFIVSLGNCALYALKRLYSDKKFKDLRSYTLKERVGELIEDTPIPIYPVYHTAHLAQGTRSQKQQEKDWMKMKKKYRDVLTGSA